MSNNLIAGYTTNDESRGDIGKLFPFVDILDGAGTAYTSIGSEPFTPNNELRYHTYQVQDSFTKFGEKHSMTFGGAFEKYYSENVFFPGKQSAYVYNTLADFYADAQRLPGEPEPDGVGGPAPAVPGALHEHPGRRQADPAAGRLLHQPLRAGRMEAPVEPDRHRRPARGHRQVRRHRVRQPGRLTRMTFRDAGGNAVKYDTGRAARRRRRCGRRASGSTGTSTGTR